MLRRIFLLLFLCCTARGQGVFDVKSYGAKGDGKTDDTAAILRAMKAAEEGKGILHFPVGTFIISRTIPITTIKNVVQFQIRGECSHEVSSSAAMPCSVLKTSGNFTAIQTPRLTTTIEGCRIKGNELNCERARFAASERGKPIEVIGAGNSVEGTKYSRSLLTNIAEVMSGTQVRLAASAQTEKSATTAYAGHDSIEHWAQYLSISDLYIQGPQRLADVPTDSVGLDLNGVQFFRGSNLHIEGFGTCLKITNGSEITFQGRTLLQNCYDGIRMQRVNHTDLQASYDNLVTVNNQRNVILDNVRSVWIKAGENITYGKALRRPPLSRVYIRNSANSAAHFDNYVGENDEAIPFISVDEAGVSVLTVDRGNFETLLESSALIDAAGEFDTIAVRNSAFPRTTGSRAPLLVLRSQATTNALLRANSVEISGNSPAWFDFYVRDDRARRNFLEDVVPARFENANPVPSLDSPHPRVNILGRFGFAKSALEGKTRLTFASPSSENYVTVQLPKPVKGATRIFVSFIVDDDGGKVVPRIHAIGGLDGGNPTEWQPIATSGLGRWLANGRALTKYGITIGILNKAKPITSVQIGNIFGDPKSAGGLEMLNVWFDTGEVGPVR